VSLSGQLYGAQQLNKWSRQHGKHIHKGRWHQDCYGQKGAQHENPSPNSEAACQAFTRGFDPGSKFLHQEQERNGSNGRRPFREWQSAVAKRRAFHACPRLLSQKTTEFQFSRLIARANARALAHVRDFVLAIPG